jgi:hypothetical protein
MQITSIIRRHLFKKIRENNISWDHLKYKSFWNESNSEKWDYKNKELILPE